MKHRPADIVSAAIDLLDREGVGVSTAKVAKAAGVANGTLFNYFPTKQDLLDAVYLHLKSEMADALGDVDPTSAVATSIRLLWDRSVTWARRNPTHRRVVRLLVESGLASSDAVAEGERLLAAPLEVMAAFERSGLMAPLPLDHLGALIEAHIDLAARSDLDGAALDIAFASVWAAITAGSAPSGSSTTPAPPTQKEAIA